MDVTHNLPTGVTILAWDGDGLPPIQRLLAACPKEADPEREGVRILLAAAWTCFPCADLGDFVNKAVLMAPPLSEYDPTLISSVAQGMNLGLEVA